MSRVSTLHVSWLLALASVLGCAQSPVIDPGSGGSPAGAAAGPEACVAAGGTCVIGPGIGCGQIGPQDCNPRRNPGGAVCCLDAPNACDEDGGSVNIASADYDRSCTADADCVAVSEGNLCFPCVQRCMSGVVSEKVAEQYRSDLAKLADPPGPEIRCRCPAAFVPRCIDGQCHVDPASSQSR